MSDMFGYGMWMWRGDIMSSSSNGTGLTQKEMLILVMEGQEKINERIDRQTYGHYNWDSYPTQKS